MFTTNAPWTLEQMTPSFELRNQWSGVVNAMRLTQYFGQPDIPVSRLVFWNPADVCRPCLERCSGWCRLVGFLY